MKVLRNQPPHLDLQVGEPRPRCCDEFSNGHTYLIRDNEKSGCRLRLGDHRVSFLIVCGSRVRVNFENHAGTVKISDATRGLTPRAA